MEVLSKFPIWRFNSFSSFKEVIVPLAPFPNKEMQFEILTKKSDFDKNLNV